MSPLPRLVSIAALMLGVPIVALGISSASVGLTTGLPLKSLFEFSAIAQQNQTPGNPQAAPISGQYGDPQGSYPPPQRTDAAGTR